MSRKYMPLMLVTGLLAGWILTGVALADDYSAVGTDLTIAKDQVQRGDIVLVDADLRIEGQVKGSIAVLSGNATITRDAEVRGDIVVIGGRLDVQSGATVAGKTISLDDDALAVLLAGVFADGGNIDEAAQRFTQARGDSIVRIGESLSVPASDRVSGDVIVIGADADVQGKVRGAAIVIGGMLEVGPDADIADDATAVGGPLEIAPSATIRGSGVALENLWLADTARARIEGRSGPARALESPAIVQEPLPPSPPDSPAVPELPAKTSSGIQRWSGDYTVGPDERVDGDIMLYNGNLKVQGRVDGDVTVAHGNAEICDDGLINGDTAIFAGNLAISGNGALHGDCAVQGEVTVKDDGRLEGDATARSIGIEGAGAITGDQATIDIPVPEVVRNLEAAAPHASLGVDGRIGILVLLILGGGLMLLCLSFFGQRARTVEAVVRNNRKRCFGWGLLGAVLAIPISTLLVALVLTIPVAVCYWIWLGALLILGLTGAVLVLGSWGMKRLKLRTESPVAQGAVGLAVLTLCFLLGAIPGIKLLAVIFLGVVVCMSLGAAMITNFGTQTEPTKPWPITRKARNGASAIPVPPVPPTPIVPPIDPWATDEDMFDNAPRYTAVVPEEEDLVAPPPTVGPEKAEPGDDEDDLSNPKPPPPPQ